LDLYNRRGWLHTISTGAPTRPASWWSWGEQRARSAQSVATNGPVAGLSLQRTQTPKERGKHPSHSLWLMSFSSPPTPWTPSCWWPSQGWLLSSSHWWRGPVQPIPLKCGQPCLPSSGLCWPSQPGVAKHVGVPCLPLSWSRCASMLRVDAYACGEECSGLHSRPWPV